MEIIKPAIVGVVQPSSERDHNSDADQDSFRRVSLPWVRFQFYDEHSVDSLYESVAKMRLSAIVFASNSLTHPAIYEASNAAAASIQRAVSGGMGVVVLQQFLPADAVRTCLFLPLAHQVDYCGIRDCQITRVDVSARAVDVNGNDALKLDATGFGTRSPTLWSEVRPLFRNEWHPFTTVRLSNKREIDVIFRSRTPRARIIVSALPLDWLEDAALLAYVIARAVRSRGTLYLCPDNDEASDDVSMQLAFGHAILHGGHLSSEVIGDPSEIDVRGSRFRHFSHLLFSPRWDWADLASFRSDMTKGRLENEGSITAHAGVFKDGQPLLVTVSGRPSYLEIADRFAKWLEVNADRFHNGPTTPWRALAVVAAAIESAAADGDAIPRPMAVDELRGAFQPYVLKRLQGHDHVDGHVLPTAAVVSAMELLRFPVAETAPLRKWIEKGAYTSSTASLQQALLWLPGLRLELGQKPLVNIDKVYDDLLRVRREGPGSPSLVRLCQILGDSAAPLSLRAIVADSLTAECGSETIALVAATALMLQNDLDACLNAANPPLEAVCLITAVLIRINSRCGLAAGPHPTPLEVDPARWAADLRRDLQSMQKQLEDHSGALARAHEYGRSAVGVSVLLGTSILVCGYVLLVINVRASFPTWLSITLPSLIGYGAILSYIGAQAARFNCEPAWLRMLRDVMKIGRG